MAGHGNRRSRSRSGLGRGLLTDVCECGDFNDYDMRRFGHVSRRSGVVEAAGSKLIIPTRFFSSSARCKRA